MILDYELRLDVPFADKDSAKKIGVRALIENNKFLCWCVPKGKDVMPFEKWWTASFRNEVSPQNKDDIKSYTLTQIMNGVTKSIQQGLPGSFWIKAEINSITGTAHKYLELVDYEAANSGTPIKGRGIIFAGQDALLRKFERDTGMKLASGMKIMFQAYVEFSGAFGLSLRIVDLNSEFVLGQTELNLKAIRNQLSIDGVFNNNRSMPQPKEFTKVALIAPEGAAGLGDLMTQADILQNHNLCTFSLYPATFQGKNAVDSIVNAFLSISEAINKGQQYDAIVVIRGGGDKAGLYALNEYAIAKALCLMPIPVIVGIGHERDSTILDELACIRLPTPSLVVSHITGVVMANMKEMISLCGELKSLSAEKCHIARMTVNQLDMSIKEDAIKIIEYAKREVDATSQNIKEVTIHQLESAKREVERTDASIKELSAQVIMRAKQEVTLLTQEILYNDPKKILSKGYAIVRDESGKATGDGHVVDEPGNKISIQFRDKTIQAVTQ